MLRRLVNCMNLGVDVGAEGVEERLQLPLVLHPLFLIAHPYTAHCMEACSAKGECNLFSLSLSSVSRRSLSRCLSRCLSLSHTHLSVHVAAEGVEERLQGHGWA